jgi:predicted nucleic-acid-binding protein
VIRSLDTNVVLRLLLGDVTEQEVRVRQMLERGRPGSFVLADAVIFECVWVLSGPVYGFGRQFIGDLLLQLIDIPQINCNRDMISRAVIRYEKYPAISFMDACLATYAELGEAVPLLTFDKNLAKALPKLAQELL